MSRRTGSTSPAEPNMPRLSGSVANSAINASRTAFWLTGSQSGISKRPGAAWSIATASCSACTAARSAGSCGSTRMRNASIT